jgi:hypothetical protein
MMAMVDPTLMMPLFQWVDSEYLEQPFFICDTICTMKNIQDNDVSIA